MQEVLVSKIFNYTSTPTKNVEGQFWFNPSTNVLSRFNGTAWKPITVSSDDVAVLTDGNKVSLTSYLNTQIAALAEGIDSKQDKIGSYTEILLPPEAGSAGGKYVVDINALSISVKTDTSNGGNINFSGGGVSVESELSANKLSVSESIMGDAVLSSISSNPVNTKILSEKAVSDALAIKQDSLQYYSEDTNNQRAEFSKAVKAESFQIGEQVSVNSGLTKLNGAELSFSTPVGVASFGYKGIEVSNAFFKVHGNDGTSTLKPYIQIPDSNGHSFKIWKGTETEFKALTSVNSDTVYLRVQENNRIKATVGQDTSSLENITDSYTLSSAGLVSFITDTKYNNAQGSILITPGLTNSGALLFGEGISDISKGFPLYPDNIVSIPFKNITNFKVAGNINDSFNYIISFDI